VRSVLQAFRLAYSPANSSFVVPQAPQEVRNHITPLKSGSVTELPSLRGQKIDFNPDKLKTYFVSFLSLMLMLVLNFFSWNLEPVIRLYEGIPRQCGFCALRFIDENRMGEHLDWHFQINSKKKQKGKQNIVRKWFLEEEDWTTETVSAGGFKVVVPEHLQAETKEDSKQSQVEKKVPSDENQPNCPVSFLFFCFFELITMGRFVEKNSKKFGMMKQTLGCSKVQ
jgi:hypothetical protein